MTETCRCRRPLITRPGALEPTCAECDSKPDFCECPILDSVISVNFGEESRRQRSRRSGDSGEHVESVSEWDAPIPFGSHGNLPDFPSGCLPPWLEGIAEQLAEEYQVPFDLPAVTSLAILSACAGGRAKVRVRGSWLEPVNLYTFVAMESGTRKSPLFADMTRPLIKAEKELVVRIRDDIATARADLDIALKRAEQAKKAAASDKATASAAEIARDLCRMAEEIIIPTVPRVVADDVTPEALVSLMAEHEGRMAILSAEGGIFSIIAGRYSKEPNMDVFLKGFSGEEIRVDRKGREPEYVPNSALTLGLCAQPEVIRDIARIPGARGRGLLARVLYSLPKEMRGWRRIITDPVDPVTYKGYEGMVCSLLLACSGWSEPMILELEPAADKLVLELQAMIEPQLRKGTGELAGIPDWASKFTGSVVRISGLLHLAKHAGLGDDFKDLCPAPIADTTVEQAIKIGYYFMDHALAVFGLMGTDDAAENAKAVLDWITQKQPKGGVFSSRDVQRAMPTRFRKAAEVLPVLCALRDHGYIQSLPAPEREKGKAGAPPSPRWVVHPNLLTDSTLSTKHA